MSEAEVSNLPDIQIMLDHYCRPFYRQEADPPLVWVEKWYLSSIRFPPPHGFSHVYRPLNGVGDRYSVELKPLNEYTVFFHMGHVGD